MVDNWRALTKAPPHKEEGKSFFRLAVFVAALIAVHGAALTALLLALAVLAVLVLTVVGHRWFLSSVVR